MNNSSQLSPQTDNTIIWALICSILLHLLIAVVIPNIRIEPPKKPEIFTIELVKKAEPEPVPAPTPEPIAEPEPEQTAPAPVKPKPTPKPVVESPPLPVEEKEDPAPIAPPPAQPDVIAVAPKPEAPPTPMPVPPPVAIKPTAPSQAEVNDANDRYGNTLWSAISKYKKYPRIAQQRGWQGEVIVELSLDGNGKLKSKLILQSSGYETLDNQALEMVEKALPFPAPPEALRGSNFTIRVPIPFKLET